MICNERQYSDQMHCSTCHLTWDMNDPHPPKCPLLDDPADEGWPLWVLLGIPVAVALATFAVLKVGGWI